MLNNTKILTQHQATHYSFLSLTNKYQSRNEAQQKAKRSNLCVTAKTIILSARRQTNIINTRQFSWTKTSQSSAHGTVTFNTIAAVTLAILPLGKWLFPTGKQFFMCNRSAQRKISCGKFPWIRQKEQTKLPMTVPDVSFMVNKTPKRLNQSQDCRTRGKYML